MADAYESGYEHLVEELSRIDALVKSQTRRWRTMIAATKTQDWGLAYVDDQEVTKYLSSRFRLGFGERAASSGANLTTEARSEREALDRSRIDARIVASAGVSLPLAELVDTFGLSGGERDLLLLTLLPELDSRYRRLYGYLLDNGNQWAPTVGLLDEMLEPSGVGLFAAHLLLEPGRPLVEHHLVVQSPWSMVDGPARRSVRIDDRIVAHLLGSAAVDSRLADAVQRWPTTGDAAAAERAEVLRQLSGQRCARVVLSGADLPAYRRTAAAIA